MIENKELRKAYLYLKLLKLQVADSEPAKKEEKLLKVTSYLFKKILLLPDVFPEETSLFSEGWRMLLALNHPHVKKNFKDSIDFGLWTEILMNPGHKQLKIHTMKGQFDQETQAWNKFVRELVAIETKMNGYEKFDIDFIPMTRWMKGVKRGQLTKNHENYHRKWHNNSKLLKVGVDYSKLPDNICSSCRTPHGQSFKPGCKCVYCGELLNMDHQCFPFGFFGEANSRRDEIRTMMELLGQTHTLFFGA